MPTRSAVRSIADPKSYFAGAVVDRETLSAAGWSPSAIRAQVDARRWQRVGRAVVRHNGSLSAAEMRQAALINLGPRALLTSFTALAALGMQGWERDAVHILVPRGARLRRPAGLPVRVHYTDRWKAVAPAARGSVDAPAHAAIRAAASFRGARPASAILAACVQQGPARPDDLLGVLDAWRTVRHHRSLLSASHDIAQGAQALSEIDFGRLCRRYGLPAPVRQAVRIEPDGRRRYVDVEWRAANGRRVVAEIDGALHLIASRWWDDQLRQNELVIAGDVVLRFPSVVLRTDPDLVALQLGRVLGVTTFLHA